MCAADPPVPRVVVGSGQSKRIQSRRAGGFNKLRYGTSVRRVLRESILNMFRSTRSESIHANMLTHPLPLSSLVAQFVPRSALKFAPLRRAGVSPCSASVYSRLYTYLQHVRAANGTSHSSGCLALVPLVSVLRRRLPVKSSGSLWCPRSPYFPCMIVAWKKLRQAQAW